MHLPYTATLRDSAERRCINPLTGGPLECNTEMRDHGGPGSLQSPAKQPSLCVVLKCNSHCPHPHSKERQPAPLHSTTCLVARRQPVWGRLAPLVVQHGTTASQQHTCKKTMWGTVHMRQPAAHTAPVHVHPGIPHTGRPLINESLTQTPRPHTLQQLGGALRDGHAQQACVSACSSGRMRCMALHDLCTLAHMRMWLHHQMQRTAPRPGRVMSRYSW